AEGVLVLVDEPSAGLHATDVARVVAALRTLVGHGASVVVVEHDLDVVAAADHVIDLGPGGGDEGGRLVAQGTVDELLSKDTRTGNALREHLAGSDARARSFPSAGAHPHGDRGGLDAIEIKHAR